MLNSEIAEIRLLIVNERTLALFDIKLFGPLSFIDCLRYFEIIGWGDVERYGQLIKNGENLQKLPGCQSS